MKPETKQLEWVCNVCGYTCTSVESPEICPQCGASKEDFEIVI